MSADFVESAAEQARARQQELPGAGIDWLDAMRRQSLESFARDGLPGRGDEPWKYTSLRAFQRQPCQPGDAEAAGRAVPAELLDIPGLDGPRLVFVHGVFRPDLSRLDQLAVGLQLLPFSQALGDGAEGLQALLEADWNTRSDAFARLNTALAAEGMVLRVAEGVELSSPIHVVQVGLGDDAAFSWHMRDVIALAPGARVSLVEQHVGPATAAHLATRVAQVDVAAGAELDWTIIQEAGPDQNLIRRERLELAEKARVQMHVAELGGKLVRHELDAVLSGDESRLETRGVFLPHGKQHIDTHIDIRHRALNTYSDALWRGVADERGRGVLHGAIVVERGADGTDASLSNKNLLLSRQAEIDSQPVLEIYADEVMAVHGATVGQLDETALFYLRSRGVPEAEARSMLTTAFCRAALDSMTNEALHEYCVERLMASLPQAGGASA